MNPNDLPYNIKKYLSDIANHEFRSQSARKEFCQSAGAQIAGVAQEFLSKYKYTLVFGALGAVVGCIARHIIRGIPVVGWVLGPIADMLPYIVGLWWGSSGFLKDCDEARMKQMVRNIVYNELERIRALYNN